MYFSHFEKGNKHKLKIYAQYNSSASRYLLWNIFIISQSWDIELEADIDLRQHCVKCVQMRSYFWAEYRKIRTRNNTVFGHCSRSAIILLLFSDLYFLNSCNMLCIPWQKMTWPDARCRTLIVHLKCFSQSSLFD